jgi:hypothetical protein
MRLMFLIPYFTGMRDALRAGELRRRQRLLPDAQVVEQDLPRLAQRVAVRHELAPLPGDQRVQHVRPPLAAKNHMKTKCRAISAGSRLLMH